MLNMEKLYKYDSNDNIIEWEIVVKDNSYTITFGVDKKQTTTVDNIQGVNIGKINETTPNEQAVLIAKKLWDDKQKYHGYATDIMEAEKLKSTSIKYVQDSIKVNKPSKFKPESISYPVLCQRKLDGIRCVAIKKDNSVNLYTSSGAKCVGFCEIENELDIIMNDGEIFDGELYKHGIPLNEISGIVRKTKSLDNKDLLEYHIHDFVKIDNLNHIDAYYDRYLRFKEIFSTCSKVFLNDVYVIHSSEEADKLYEQFICDDYEGMIYRSLDMIYEFKRQKDMQKRKDFKEDDCLILGIHKEGTGNKKGSIGSLHVSLNGKEFNLTPNLTYEESKFYFENQELIIGKYITIRYLQCFDGIPQIAKGIRIRDEKGID